MNLIVDIGNSRIKISITAHGEIISTQIGEGDGMDALKKVMGFSTDLQKAIVSNVRKENHSFMELLQNQIPQVIELSKDTSLPLKIDYKTPHTLGMDRIAAAVGAIRMYPGKELLVIDAGTAITMDRVTSNAIFLGGKISPGIHIRFRALHSFTDRLPLVGISESWNYPGKDTAESIECGVLEGILFEMEGTIQFLRNQIDNLHVVLTGGDSVFFAKNLKSPIFVNSNLNTIGLDRILEFNT